jgi:hypothetical protein
VKKKRVFVDYRKNWCLISSLADNWDLNEFFERFICGRWYIHLEQMTTIYHLFRPIIITSGWLWSPVVEHHLQWLIVISRINHHRWYSSLLNKYRIHQMNIVCSRWISSLSDEYQLIFKFIYFIYFFLTNGFISNWSPFKKNLQNIT